MKNLIKLLGIIALVAVIGFSMVACPPEPDPTHEHQWGVWVITTAANCTTAGSQTRTCALDATHTDTEVIAIDPNAHNYQNYAQTTAPTCETDGEETGTCTYESSHKSMRPITALGHDYQNYAQTTVPTCTTAGIETGTCTRDQVTTTRTGAAALGHNYQSYIETTVPTCTTVGKEEAPCTRDSNHEKGIRDIAINPNAHAYGNWITTTPTCTTTGIDTRTCSLNATHKETRNEIAINPNAHDWNTDTGLCDNDCGGLYYSLGDTGPGGGKIFYVSAEGFTMTDDNTTAHYLEAAPADMATTLAWASSAFLPPDWGGTGSWTYIADTATEIGTGRKNTALILATDAHAPAAEACNDYSNGGKTDWFLPSQDELNQLYVNRSSVGNLKTTADNVNYTHTYWSSSHDSSLAAAQYQFFSIDIQSSGIKQNSFSVRAVRAF
ncbi:MAG: DUF1566 domain-containing protein [Treponema sp.]|nr:DUF1566 domain-containing protein [Treponema sp.]